jgi:hypothetical protein
MEYHQPWNATLPNGTEISGEFKFVSITLAVSTDGGQWFSHAASPPNHLIATMQLAWNATVPNYGYRMPSNILQGKRPEHQGFFYATFNTGVHDERFSPPSKCAHSTHKDCGSMWSPDQPAGWADGVVGGQELGTCIMRTRDLSDASSWRAWDGTFTSDLTETNESGSESGNGKGTRYRRCTHTHYTPCTYRYASCTTLIHYIYSHCPYRYAEPSFTVDLSRNPYGPEEEGRPWKTCAVLAKPNPHNHTAASYNGHNTVLWSTHYKRYMVSAES